MIVTKLQKRQRSIKARFTNADMLGLDTAGTTELVPGVVGYGLELREVRFLANIVGAYNNIGAAANTPSIQVFSQSFGGQCCAVENTAGGDGATSYSDLLHVTGIRTTVIENASAVFVESASQTVWSLVWNIEFSSGAGIQLKLTNGVAGDLTGGDPANYMDVFVDYNIIKIA